MVLAGLVCVGLTVTACSGEGDGGAKTPDGSGSPAAANPLAAVEWVEGDSPSLDFAKPFNLNQPSASRVAKAGDGAEVKPGDLVLMDYALFGGLDGSLQASTYEGGPPDAYIVTEQPTDGDYIREAINGQKVGAQVVLSFTTPGQAAANADGSASPAPDDTYLVALSIKKAQPMLKSAEGEALTPDQPGLPTVSFGEDGKPSIAIPEGAEPPAELVSQRLIEGTGPAVAADQAVGVNYAGWLWDGTQFDSSWERGAPTAFFLSGVVQGWAQGLTGVPVGSRVLLVVPPELGYKDQDMGTIPPNSTLVFVVDILAAA
jgi:peptidylprolyl isomerase